MSIRLMSQIWDKSPYSGSQLLVLLALADWATDDGVCYPAISSVAAKCRLSEKQARRLVHGLIDDGILDVIGNEFGGNPGSSRRYKISLTPPAGVTPPANVTPPTGVPDPSHRCPLTPPAGGSQTIIEPPLTVIVSQTRKTQLLESFKPDQTCQQIALENNLDLSKEILQFADHHRGKGSMQVDWQATLRTWLRNAVKFRGNGNGNRNDRDADRRNTIEQLTGKPAHGRTVVGDSRRVD